MNYLDTKQLEDCLMRGKSVEYWLGAEDVNGHETFKWLSIDKGVEAKEKYSLILHHVFNDSEEGLDSIYDFSYVEPDDLYGKIVASFHTSMDVLRLAESEFKTNMNQFCPEGYMNDFLIDR